MHGGGHQTGGAIDLTICNANGEALDMGTSYLEFNASTPTNNRNLTIKQKENRALLVSVILYFVGIENPSSFFEYFIAKPSISTVILYIVLVLLIIIKHRKNYIRLLNGTESCFKSKKTN